MSHHLSNVKAYWPHRRGCKVFTTIVIVFLVGMIGCVNTNQQVQTETLEVQLATALAIATTANGARFTAEAALAVTPAPPNDAPSSAELTLRSVLATATRERAHLISTSNQLATAEAACTPPSCEE